MDDDCCAHKKKYFSEEKLINLCSQCGNILYNNVLYHIT